MCAAKNAYTCVYVCTKIDTIVHRIFRLCLLLVLRYVRERSFTCIQIRNNERNNEICEGIAHRNNSTACIQQNIVEHSC